MVFNLHLEKIFHKICLLSVQTHAIMGTNGSGKSTLSKCLVGHPDYEVTAGSGNFSLAASEILSWRTHASIGTFITTHRTLQLGLAHSYADKSGCYAVTYKGQDLLSLQPEERARAGLFMR